MALTQVTGPYPIFTDLDGSPLDDGYLYIGETNQDPETNPIQVYWDSNLTIPASQPIRTNSGYAYRNGTPALIYTGGQFSITIRNKRQEFVLYSPVGYGFDPGSVSASVTKNDFTGDGVTVDFAISTAPATILATNVFINGVYQEKNSYSILGNIVTFSIAPPIGSSIEILTNQTGIINTGYASDITYIASFSGSVVQTVQTKLEQYVSIKDFGGDLVAAINAAGATETTLVVNDAVTLSTTLTVPSNVTLRFENTGLITIAGSARLFINGAVQADRLQHIFSCNLFTNSITASIDANELTITAAASNTVAPGQIVTGAGLRDGIQIFQEYGDTGVGTYGINGYNGIIASQAMTLVSSPVIFGAGTVEEVYPTWFGAVNDGATDSTEAVQLAVYSQTWGGTVRFPAGGYVVTDIAVLHPGMTIEGDGVNNDYSGSPPPDLSVMSTIFVTADNVSAFVISERCNQVNIRNLVFSSKNPPYLSGGDYAPYGTNRRAIRYEGHAPQGIFGGVIDACQFFGFASAILANDTWAGVGDGVGAPGTYWNGTASVPYYDWQINPLEISNCQFVGSTYGVLVNSNNCDAWRIVDCVFVLPVNGNGVNLLRCGFIKLDNCFAFAGNTTNTEFVNLIGNGAEALDNVTLDNCQAENCSHFINFAAGSTNTTPPQINVRNSIHQISADVYLGSPCEYNSQNNHIMSYVYVDSTNVRVNSINDKFQFLNFSSGPTWNIVVVSGDADSINTYVPGRNPSSVLGENAWFNGSAINSTPSVQTVSSYTVATKDVAVIFDVAATSTLTLPVGSLFPGRRIRVVTRQARAVLSSQSNIIPITGGAATNAILAATAGKWADLESDGTYWVITASN